MGGDGDTEEKVFYEFLPVKFPSDSVLSLKGRPEERFGTLGRPLVNRRVPVLSPVRHYIRDNRSDPPSLSSTLGFVYPGESGCPRRVRGQSSLAWEAPTGPSVVLRCGPLWITLVPPGVSVRVDPTGGPKLSTHWKLSN